MRDDFPPARRTALQRIVTTGSARPDASRFSCASPTLIRPSVKNTCTKPAATGEKFFRARSDGGIHPVARFAMRRAAEEHTLHFEIEPDQIVQLDPGNDHVPAQRTG